MLENEIALVTGASRGIGRAIAIELGRRGARVIGTATSESGARAIDEYLGAEQIGGRGVVLDVANAASVEACFKDIDGREGTPTILVNNAGVTRDGLLMRMSADDWQTVIETVLSAVFRTCKAVMRGMMKARRGRIINIGSVMSTHAAPGMGAYTVSKHGVAGLTRTLALELGPFGVTANYIQPGAIVTGITRGVFAADAGFREFWTNKAAVKRLGQPEDIAAAIAFLASDEASFITGHGLLVDGGALQSP
jgi:3-oxoacyl-[acyl-carrier protein] reductase